MDVDIKKIVELIATRDGEAEKLLEVFCGSSERLVVPVTIESSTVLAFAYCFYAQNAHAGGEKERADLESLLSSIAKGKLSAHSKKTQAAFVALLDQLMNLSYWQIIYDALEAACVLEYRRPERRAALKALNEKIEAEQNKLRPPSINSYEDDDSLL